MSCVYLLGDWEKEGCFKIGVTRGDINKRIKKLQTGNPGKIYLVDKYETDKPFLMEKMLHTWYGSKRVMNEWFEMDAEDILNFGVYCKDIEKILEELKDNYYFQKKYGDGTTSKKRNSTTKKSRY